MYRKTRADRRGHRLFDRVGRLARTGEFGGVAHGSLLDAGDARRHRDHHARLGPASGVHFLDEVAQHLLADIEVGDDAIAQRTHRRDVRWRATDHAFGLGTDRDRTPIVHVDRDDRRLVQHDAFAAHIDQRVCRAQIDGHVAADDRAERAQDLDHARRPFVVTRA